jgi:Fe-S-cluster containining protein
MWEKECRTDILEWVDPIDCGDGKRVYDIWINPKTGEDVPRCPWLRKLPKKNKYCCRIHEVRPKVCREYPKTGKHAKKTGCKGFEP